MLMDDILRAAQRQDEMVRKLAELLRLTLAARG